LQLVAEQDLAAQAVQMQQTVVAVVVAELAYVVLIFLLRLFKTPL